MLVMDRVRHAAILPSRDDRSERAKTVQPNIQKNRSRTTVAEPIWGNASGIAFYRRSGRLFRPQPGRLERTCINEGGNPL
jgi:hypothetical protein